MKTARFADVVAAAGPPQVHSLWIAPGRDPSLKRAVRECRVMTIHQMLRGTKKDYGTVGLHADESSQVLVFPKSLRRFGEARIVGIDYRLIVQPDPKDPAPAVAKAGAGKPAKRAPSSGSSRQAAGSPPLDKLEALRPSKGLAATSRQSTSTNPNRHLKPAKPLPPFTRDELLAEIRRAVRDLKAGKTVAAHERLNKLIAD
jgi:hypothetical protein